MLVVRSISGDIWGDMDCLCFPLLKKCANEIRFDQTHITYYKWRPFPYGVVHTRRTTRHGSHFARKALKRALLLRDVERCAAPFTTQPLFFDTVVLSPFQTLPVVKTIVVIRLPGPFNLRYFDIGTHRNFDIGWLQRAGCLEISPAFNSHIISPKKEMLRRSFCLQPRLCEMA